MTLEFQSSSEPRREYAMVTCTCCSRLVPGKIIHWHDNPEMIPLWMPCTSCGMWLGHLEEDNKDVLDGMCLDCFGEIE